MTPSHLLGSALLERLPLPNGVRDLEFVPRCDLGDDKEMMIVRLDDGRRVAEVIDLEDCKSVIYIHDYEARGLLAFLAKKPVLSLDSRRVEGKRRLAFSRAISNHPPESNMKETS